MEPIKDTINEVMQQLRSKKNETFPQGLELAFRQALKKQEKQHAKLEYCNKGTVCVVVDSSAWLYHLSLRKKTILKKLRKTSKTIKDIRFRIGDF
ncbi:MAG: hypothetical protein DRP74_05935 [Candidatus Omnitrophota bacterium]|nr:MAG: hypothetical protein DRP74_05935 [Candidatus Omnitrophota bacterium]